MKFINCSQNRKKPEDEIGSIHNSTDLEWLDTREAAEYLRLTAHSLLNLTSAGKIPFYKLGRRNRFKRNDLDAILERKRMGPNGN